MARPKLIIDYEMVEKLATIMATQEEISAVLEISTRTLQRDAEFCRIYKKGMERGKASLRRMQWRSAENGNVTMQIWLGKQMLGQSDKIETQGNHNIQTNLDLRHISTEDLRKMIEDEDE